MAYFRSDIYIIVFFLWGGMKTSGSAGLFNKKKFCFTSSGAQRWAEREMGNTKKNTATLTSWRGHKIVQFFSDQYSDGYHFVNSISVA